MMQFHISFPSQFAEIRLLFFNICLVSGVIHSQQFHRCSVIKVNSELQIPLCQQVISNLPCSNPNQVTSYAMYYRWHNLNGVQRTGIRMVRM
jgi:hypothetical protein